MHFPTVQKHTGLETILHLYWENDKGIKPANDFQPAFSGHSDDMFVGHTSRGHTGGRSHRISHPRSFSGACLHFSREKDSAIPFFPSSTMKSNFVFTRRVFLFVFFCFFCEKNLVCQDRTHVPTCQKVTRLPLSYRGDRLSRVSSIKKNACPLYTTAFIVTITRL